MESKRFFFRGSVGLIVKLLYFFLMVGWVRFGFPWYSPWNQHNSYLQNWWRTNIYTFSLLWWEMKRTKIAGVNQKKRSSTKFQPTYFWWPKTIKIPLLHQEAPMQCGISLFPSMSPELTVPFLELGKHGKTATGRSFVFFFFGSLEFSVIRGFKGWYVGYNRQQIYRWLYSRKLMKLEPLNPKNPETKLPIFSLSTPTCIFLGMRVAPVPGPAIVTWW